jgi:hypothetical protein
MVEALADEKAALKYNVIDIFGKKILFSQKKFRKSAHYKNIHLYQQH